MTRAAIDSPCIQRCSVTSSAAEKAKPFNPGLILLMRTSPKVLDSFFTTAPTLSSSVRFLPGTVPAFRTSAPFVGGT